MLSTPPRHRGIFLQGSSSTPPASEGFYTTSPGCCGNLKRFFCYCFLAKCPHPRGILRRMAVHTLCSPINENASKGLSLPGVQKNIHRDRPLNDKSLLLQTMLRHLPKSRVRM